MAAAPTRPVETRMGEAVAMPVPARPEEWVSAEIRRRLGGWDRKVRILLESLETGTGEGMTEQDWLLKARAWASLEELNKAVEYYDTAIKHLKPRRAPADLASAHRERADALAELGRHEEALADYNRALELRPDDPTTLNNRGLSLDDLKRYDEALPDYYSEPWSEHAPDVEAGAVAAFAMSS